MKSRWKRISMMFGVTGLLCILAAGLFALYNLYDDSRAGRELKAETALLESLVLSPERARALAAERLQEELLMPDATEGPTSPPLFITPQPSADAEQPQASAAPAVTETPAPEPTPEPTASPRAMPVIRANGTDYVAILSIPALDLELCVRSEWTKEGLKNSPCRYAGSVDTDDLVICAHNFSSHFGRLKELQEGDEILLVDMNGELYRYCVDRIEQVEPFAVDYMIDTDYPLSLFTCTVGGKARVTVRCTRVS